MVPHITIRRRFYVGIDPVRAKWHSVVSPSLRFNRE